MLFAKLDSKLIVFRHIFTTFPATFVRDYSSFSLEGDIVIKPAPNLPWPGLHALSEVQLQSHWLDDWTALGRRMLEAG